MDKDKLINYLKKHFPDYIVNAFLKIKREEFIPKEFKEYAYLDKPIPLATGSTISQPYTVAFMLNILELDKLKNDNTKVLEVGFGSGYVLAFIDEI